MPRNLAHALPPDDEGLARDLPELCRRTADRRRWLGWMVAGTLVPGSLLACGGGDADSGYTATLQVAINA